MRVVQTPPQRSQWGNPGGATNRGYGTTQQRPVSSVGRLPVAPPTARGSTMSPTRMRMVTSGMNNRKYVAPSVNRMRPPQPRVESRQVPVSPPRRMVPKKQNSVIDLTDFDECDIDKMLPKRTPPAISPPKNRAMINPPRRYQYPVPPPASKQQRTHIPKVMPEQGRKPRIINHHPEVQRLSVAPASKHGLPRGPESPRSPMNMTKAGQASAANRGQASAANRGHPSTSHRGQASTGNRASQRLAVASASRAAQKSNPVTQASKNETKRAAPSKKHEMSIADRLRAVNDSRPGNEQKDSNSTDEENTIKKETINGSLPQSPQQAKKEFQPSFDSAYTSAYSAYTSCTDYTNYTEPSMDSDITPFDTQNASGNRDFRVESELIKQTRGKLAAESIDEFDGKACLIATKELTEMLASDVKEVANFAQGTFTGENQNTDSMSIENPNEKTETKTELKTESNEKSTKIAKKETGPTTCLGETQDCMMSFQEDVALVAEFSISKIQEACLPDGGEEESTSIAAEGTKNKAATQIDESSCVNETGDCMQSFKEDVSYVTGLGASKVLGKQGSTSTVEGASGQKQMTSSAKDDDSDVFAATADCFVQLKDDIKFGVAQMKGMKLSELEVRGLVVSIAQGLNEPIYLPDGGDTGSVLTDDFRSSTASVNDLDSLDDSQDGNSADGSAPSIDGMSQDPFVNSAGEAPFESIKNHLVLETLKSEELDDPVVEEILKVDPPGDDDEELNYTIVATKSTNGRADPPAADKPFDELPSIAPGDTNDADDGVESVDSSIDGDVYIEETEDLATVEETVEEEVFDEETIEEEIEEQNADETLERPDDEVMDEEEENITLETETETVDSPVDDLEALEKADDVPFPDLLPDEI
ncbi:MAG: hypothetical protein SGBAC_001401 [Bacillariaceae sp.]